MVINNISKGSCVSRGGGGAASYKKKLLPLYILLKKGPDGHKISIIDICYANTAPDTLKLYFINEKFNTNLKVEKLKKSWGELYALSLYVL